MKNNLKLLITTFISIPLLSLNSSVKANTEKIEIPGYELSNFYLASDLCSPLEIEKLPDQCQPGKKLTALIYTEDFNFVLNKISIDNNFIISFLNSNQIPENNIPLLKIFSINSCFNIYINLNDLDIFTIENLNCDGNRNLYINSFQIAKQTASEKIKLLLEKDILETLPLVENYDLVVDELNPNNLYHIYNTEPKKGIIIKNQFNSPFENVSIIISDDASKKEDNITLIINGNYSTGVGNFYPKNFNSTNSHYYKEVNDFYLEIKQQIINLLYEKIQT